MLLILALLLSLLTPLKADFREEWRRFVHLQQLDRARISSPDNLINEFNALEQFGLQQLHRRRPAIAEIDRNLQWTPYHENRVTLQNGTEMSASHIGFSSELQPNYHNFIASQAPYAKNIHLFWQMVVENRVNQVVMVTELKETKRELCPCYWPEKVGQTLKLENGLELKLVKEKSLLAKHKNSIQIRTIQVSYKGRSKLVNHYWYRNWPDHTAPVDPTPLLTLIATVKSDHRTAAPILVHCHGGVGRTGVFVTLYHMLQRQELGDRPLTLFECVAQLRWQRAKMVGNPVQYQFCHGVLRLLGMN